MKLGKHMATTGIAVAILVLGIGSALAAPARATGSVNVRTGPSVGFPRIDTLYRGERVDVRQCRNGWCFVTHRGPDGWVSARYLSRTVMPYRSGPSVNFHFGFPFGNRNPPRPYYHPFPPPPPRW